MAHERLKRSISIGVSIAAAAGLVATAVLLTTAPVHPAPELGPGILAGIAYFASHILRAIRLAVLVDDHAIGLRRIGLVHLYTAGVNLVMPWKLGEAYRAYELGHAIRDWPRAVFTIWIERMFDGLAVTLLLLTVGWWWPPLPAGSFGLGLTLGLFFIITLLTFVLLPEHSAGLKRYVLIRYDAEWSVIVLRGLTWLQSTVCVAPILISRKWATLLTVTAGVWILEVAAVAALVPGISPDSLSQMPSALVMLVDTLAGRSPFAPVGWAGFGDPIAIATFVPLLAVALICMAIYLPARVRHA